MNELRRDISSSKALQQAADTLLREINRTMGSLKGDEMLSAMIDQVRQGADLEHEFPAFHQLLEGDPELKRAFEALLTLFEDEDQPLPGFVPPTRADLGFLWRDHPAEPAATRSAADWRIVLQRGLEELQQLFSPPALAYRDAVSGLEERWFTLLRDEVSIDEARLAVVLDASISEHTAESLELLLQIAVIRIDQDTEIPEELSAGVAWGGYQHTLPVQINKQNKLPAAAFSQVLTPDYESIAASLTLTLSPPDA